MLAMEAMWLGILLVVIVCLLVGLALAVRQIGQLENTAVARTAAMQAILVGFKGAEWSVETLGVYLRGVERGHLAQLSYPLLPPILRAQITEEAWAEIVPVVYGELITLWEENAEAFLAEVEELVAHEPA
jgi:hypothetical protein